MVFKAYGKGETVFLEFRCCVYILILIRLKILTSLRHKNTHVFRWLKMRENALLFVCKIRHPSAAVIVVAVGNKDVVFVIGKEGRHYSKVEKFSLYPTD